MKTAKYLILIGTVLILTISLVAGACAPAALTGEEGAEEIAKLEGDLAASEKKVDQLEDEIAALRVPAKTYTWKFQSHSLAVAPIGRTFFSTAQPVLDELTGGRIKLERHDAGVLAKSTETCGAVAAGAIEMADTLGGYNLGNLGTAGEFFSPLLPHQSPTEWSILWHEFGMEDIERRAYDSRLNVHLIGCIPSTPSLPWWSSIPIRSIEDIEGMKFRCYGMQTALLGMLGAETVYLPLEESYSAIATGVVDAMTGGPPGDALPFGYPEVAPYMTQPSFAAGGIDIVINPQLWNELTPDLQAALEAMVRSWEPAIAREWMMADVEAIPILLEEWGCEFIPLPDEDVREITELAYEVMKERAAGDEFAEEALAALVDFWRYMGRF